MTPSAAHAPEEDFVPLSALQHYLFCPRQCALIHLERVWEENVLTAEGRVLHESANTLGSEKRRDLKTLTAVPLSSKRLCIAGVADVVELHLRDGVWHPFPVEYKRGRPKAHRADEVQLCAQAMCLEEMHALEVPDGALFYGQNRRRQPVAFDEALRKLTQETAAGVHALFAQKATPPARYDKAKCEACSLANLCRPRLLSRREPASAWLARQLAEGAEPCDAT
jgi:CRISPR-associated exonuclease Cas4